MYQELEAKPPKFNYKLDKVPRGLTGSHSCRLNGLTRDPKADSSPLQLNGLCSSTHRSVGGTLTVGR